METYAVARLAEFVDGDGAWSGSRALFNVSLARHGERKRGVEGQVVVEVVEEEGDGGDGDARWASGGGRRTREAEGEQKVKGARGTGGIRRGSRGGRGDSRYNGQTAGRQRPSREGRSAATSRGCVWSAAAVVVAVVAALALLLRATALALPVTQNKRRLVLAFEAGAQSLEPRVRRPLPCVPVGSLPFFMLPPSLSLFLSLRLSLLSPLPSRCSLFAPRCRLLTAGAFALDYPSISTLAPASTRLLADSSSFNASCICGTKRQDSTAAPPRMLHSTYTRSLSARCRGEAGAQQPVQHLGRC